MAQRRMFSLKVIDTDRFLEMSPTAQNLYFHLGMRADDDGFVSAPKKIMQMCGAPDDDMKVLIAKGFIVPMATNGVCVITHWRMNNLIRPDRYVETDYKEEKKRLRLVDNKWENDIPKIGIPNDNQMTTKDGIGKVRLGKVRLGKVSTIGLDKPTVSRKKQSFKQDDYVKVADAYQALKGLTLVGNEFLPVQQAVKSMFMSKRTPDQIIEFMTWLKEKAESDDKKWVWTKNWTINTVKIKLPEHIAGLLEEKEEAKIPYYAKGYIK